MSAIGRLRRMGKTELAWRAAAMTRVWRDRAAVAIRPPSWDRRELLRALSPAARHASLADALRRGDWPSAEAALKRRLCSRPSRFVLDPLSATTLRTVILERCPGAQADAASRGESLLRGQFDVLGYRDVSFANAGDAIDWHYDPVHRRRAPRRFWADVPYLDPACGDHKVIWELNRHQHWLALGRALWLTGDRRFGRAIIDQLSHWMAENPPLVGINWASMLELGFRCLSWNAALHFLLASDRGEGEGFDGQLWLIDLLIGLDRQLRHIEDNLSYYFSPNTHLTGEALALYVVGQALPELDGSGRWVRTGRAILLQEIERQILPDGGHAERSMHYHRYTLDFYLLALLVAERCGDTSATTPLRDAVSRLARFALTMADDDGRLAMIGDDDGGMLWPFAGRDPRDVRDSLALASLLVEQGDLAPWGIQEETCWLYGAGVARAALPRTPAPLPPAVFPDTGYAVLRDAAGSHMIFDTGGHGFMNAGHAHADALAVTLTLDGVPLLIDPGTGSYTMNPVARDRFRHTRSHNTLTVDGQASAEPAGPFHWRTRADARLAGWRANARFAWAEGAHDSFPAACHRRSVVHADRAGWLLLDEVIGDGPHSAEVHFHFDPQWTVSSAPPARFLATHVAGRRAWLLHEGGAASLVKGDAATGEGWCAPAYGAVVPTWTGRFDHGSDLPLSMFTWIGSDVDTDAGPVLERLHVQHDGAAPAHAVRVSGSRYQHVAVLRPGDSPLRKGRACATADYRTDARVLLLTKADGAIRSIALADGTQVLALHDNLPGIDCEQPVQDLHVSVKDDLVELVASVPPARLTLRGPMTDTTRTLRLNGRELRPHRTNRLDAITVDAADWADRIPDTRATCVA